MKHTIFKIGFFLIAFSISYSLLSQENMQTQHIIDSLSAEVNKVTGEQKLEVLNKLADMNVYSVNLFPIIDMMEKEARSLENNSYLLRSYNYRINYYTMNYDSDSVTKYIELSAPVSKILNPTEQVVTSNESLKAMYYTSIGLFDLAVIQQQRYLERIEKIDNEKPEILHIIYLGMGSSYYYLEKYEEALKYYELSNDILSKVNQKAIPNITSLLLIATCHTNLENYSEANQYCDSVRNIINGSSITTTESHDIFESVLEMLDIQIYSGLKDFDKAKPLVDKAISNINASRYQSKEQIANFYSKIIFYYSAIGNYSAAMKYNELGLALLEEENNMMNLQNNFRKEKALLLYHTGHYKEAFDLFSDNTIMMDSVRKSKNTLQLDELATMYDVDLKDAEIAETNAHLKLTYTIIFVLLIAFIFLFTLMLVIRANSRTQKAKNKALFKQQEEQKKSIDYYKKLIVKDIASNTSDNNLLYQKLEDYIQEEQAYKNPEINREDVSVVMNTNRQYLSKAIKDATGLTFTAYINKYRLDEARRLLLENDDLRIEDIIVESGFSSHPTFHRLFKEQYGMTPLELKRAASALQDEIRGGDNELN